jgi:hypothetical protein
MTDDLFAVPADPTRPERPPRKCGRHDWSADEDMVVTCRRCGKVRDEAVVRTNRNNAKRGKRIQRERIVALGGQNLPGNKPNHDGIGLAFSYESKSGGFFSERVWRVLSGIPTKGDQTAVLIVTATDGPGHKARAYVVVEFDEWKALHGEVEMPSMTERLARAIRSIIGYPVTPTNHNPTWYIDIDSRTSDDEVLGLAADIAREYAKEAE